MRDCRIIAFIHLAIYYMTQSVISATIFALFTQLLQFDSIGNNDFQLAIAVDALLFSDSLFFSPSPNWFGHKAHFTLLLSANQQNEQQYNRNASNRNGSNFVFSLVKIVVDATSNVKSIAQAHVVFSSASQCQRWPKQQDILIMNEFLVRCNNSVSECHAHAHIMAVMQWIQSRIRKLFTSFNFTNSSRLNCHCRMQKLEVQ